MSRPAIPIATVEPSDIVYEGLCRILARSRFRIAFRCQTLDQMAETSPPDDPQPEIILIHSAVVPDAEELTRLARSYSGAKVVIIANQQICRDVVLGGRFTDGVMLDSSRADVFLKTLELVALGERILPAEAFVPGAVPARDMTPSTIPDSLQRLSEREREVLQLLCTGSPNKLIARELDISEATVKVHVKAILRKTNVRNRTEAALLMRPLIEHHATSH